jgi:excisionase family DNA binding protein
VNALVLPGQHGEEAAPPAAWLRLDEVAAILRVSLRTVTRMTSREAGRDRLLAARFGGVVRVRRETLEKYMTTRERTS